MMRCVVLAASVLFAAGCATEDEAADRNTDSQSIQGAWKVMELRSGGEPIPPEPIARVRFQISADELTIRSGTDDPMTLRYTLVPSKSPKHIDTTHELDPGESILQRGIYEIDGETLKLCLAAAGAPRPETFEDRDAASFVLERVDGEP